MNKKHIRNSTSLLKNMKDAPVGSSSNSLYRIRFFQSYNFALSGLPITLIMDFGIRKHSIDPNHNNNIKILNKLIVNFARKTIAIRHVPKIFALKNIIKNSNETAIAVDDMFRGKCF